MSDIAPDTNLLITVTPRRWLTVLQEMRGRRTVITPTVAHQVETRMGKLTERYMLSQFERHPPRDERSAKQAMIAAKQADLEWWLGERSRNDSAYEFITLSTKERNEVRRELLRLPALAFTDRDLEDMHIVAEAIVIGVLLIVSHNFSSITLSEIETEMAKGHCGSIDIRRPRDAFELLCEQDGTDRSQRLLDTFVATATDSGISGSPEMQVGSYIRAWSRFEDNIPDSHQLAELAERIYRTATLESWVVAKESARRHVTGNARRTETRYHQGRRRAVRDTGYDPW